MPKDAHQLQKCIEYSFIYVPEYLEHYGICSGQLQLL